MSTIYYSVYKGYEPSFGARYVIYFKPPLIRYIKSSRSRAFDVNNFCAATFYTRAYDQLVSLKRLFYGPCHSLVSLCGISTSNRLVASY